MRVAATIVVVDDGFTGNAAVTTRLCAGEHPAGRASDPWRNLASLVDASRA